MDSLDRQAGASPGHLLKLMRLFDRGKQPWPLQ
jgi:hypothetical protein